MAADKVTIALFICLFVCLFIQFKNFIYLFIYLFVYFFTFTHLSMTLQTIFHRVQVERNKKLVT